MKSRIGVAEARMDYHEGDRRGMTLSKKLIDLADKALGFVPSTKTAVDMPQEGEREGVARKAKSLLKRGNSSLTSALAPGRPPEHEMCVKGIRERFDGPPGLTLRLSRLACGEIYPGGRCVREE